MTRDPQVLCTGEPALIPGALTGYRTFSLNGSGQIKSTNVDHVWDNADQTARCLQLAARCRCPLCTSLSAVMGGHPAVAEPHAAPAVDCACGIYGWYAPDDTRIVPADVFAAVRVEGRALLGTHGFRAERVRLLGVVLPEGHRPDGLQQLISQGVTVHETRTALLKAYPPEDVSGLVEHTCEEGCTKDEIEDMSMALIAKYMGQLINHSTFAWGAGTGAPAPVLSTSRLAQRLATDPPAGAAPLVDPVAIPPSQSKANIKPTAPAVSRVLDAKRASNGPKDRKAWWLR